MVEPELDLAQMDSLSLSLAAASGQLLALRASAPLQAPLLETRIALPDAAGESQGGGCRYNWLL